MSEKGETPPPGARLKVHRRSQSFGNSNPPVGYNETAKKTVFGQLPPPPSGYDAVKQANGETEALFDKAMKRISAENEEYFITLMNEKNVADTEFKRRLNSLHSELAEKDTVIENLQGQLEESRQLNSIEQSEHTLTKENMSRMAASNLQSLSESGYEVDVLRGEKQQLVDRLRDHSHNLTSALQKAEDDHMLVIKGMRKEWDKERTDYHKKIHTARETADQFRDQNQNLDRQLQSAHHAISEEVSKFEKQKGTYFTESITHTTTISDLSTSVDALTAEKAALLYEIKMLHKSQIDQIAQVRESSKHDLGAAASLMEVAKEQSLEHMDRLNEQKTNKVIEIEQLKVAHSEQVSKLEIEANSAKERVENLIVEREQLQEYLKAQKESDANRYFVLASDHQKDIESLSASKKREFAQIASELMIVRQMLLDEKRGAAALKAQLDAQMTSQLAEVEDLQLRASQLEMQKAGLQEHIQENQKSFDETRTELTAQCEERLKKFAQEKDAFEIMMKSKFDERSLRESGLHKTLVETENKLLILKSEKAALQKSRAADKLDFGIEFEAVKSDLVSVKSELSAAHAEANTKREEIISLKTSHAQEMEMLQQSHNEQMNGFFETKHKMDAKYGEQLDALRDQLVQTDQEKSMIKVKLHELFKKTETVLKATQRDSEILQSEKQVLLERAEGLETAHKAQIESLARSHQDALENLQAHHNQNLKATQVKLDDLESDLQEEKKTIVRQNIDLDKLRSEKTVIEHTATETEGKLESVKGLLNETETNLRVVTTTLKQKAGKLTTRIEELKLNHSKECKKLVTDYKRTHQLLQDQNSTLRTQHSEQMAVATQRYAELENQQAQQEGQIEDYQAAVVEAKRKCSHLQLQIDARDATFETKESDSKRSYNQIKEQLNRSEKQLKLTIEHHRLACSRIQTEARNDAAIVKETLAAVEKGLRSKVEELKKQIDLKSSTNDEINRSLTDKENEVEEQNRNIRTLEIRLTGMEQDFERQRVRYESEIKVLKNSLDEKTERAHSFTHVRSSSVHSNPRPEEDSQPYR